MKCFWKLIPEIILNRLEATVYNCSFVLWCCITDAYFLKVYSNKFNRKKLEIQLKRNIIPFNFVFRGFMYLSFEYLHHKNINWDIPKLHWSKIHFRIDESLCLFMPFLAKYLTTYWLHLAHLASFFFSMSAVHIYMRDLCICVCMLFVNCTLSQTNRFSGVLHDCSHCIGFVQCEIRVRYWSRFRNTTTQWNKRNRWNTNMKWGTKAHTRNKNENNIFDLNASLAFELKKCVRVIRS